jgi:aminopeptidase N
MDQPHAPYLFFMGVGDYAIVKDSYKGKEVSYYVEKEYEKVARKIFGHTPEMMDFFSKKLGVEYPWVKYSQIVGRDYVSGAMENTTATLHQESAQQDARELVDGNEWESTIAHELFHHWFGDLVTAESWSNLPVNESFADYSQYLWIEHKYGKDEALFENFNQMRGYLASGQSNRDLIRFYYNDKEDMFDAVSYNKGGRILHMLRSLVGDDAFFSSLNKYLTANKFGNGNAHKLRLAFEEVTGTDLNWFFNQWFFGNGHPQLDINYGYNAETQTATVIIQQIQKGDKLFKLPIDIDIWHGHEKERKKFWLEHKADTFQFKVRSQPDLMNIDPERVLLVEKKENKNFAQYSHQFNHSDNYLNRREALAYAGSIMSNDTAAASLVKKALSDPYFRIRSLALNLLAQGKTDAATLKTIEQLAVSDKKTQVKADAIDVLGLQENKAYQPLFLKAVRDSSYGVAGAALEAIAALDSSLALSLANEMVKSPAKGRLNTAIADILILYGDESAYDFVSNSYDHAPLSFTKVQMSISYILFAAKIKDQEKVRAIVKDVVAFRDLIPPSAKSQTNPPMNNALKALADKKEAAGQKELAAFIRSQIPADGEEEKDEN